MSKAQGQFTIIDYNDALTLTGYIGSNLAKTQMFNPDNSTYSPDWSSTNLVLTPSLYVIGTTTDQITSTNVQSVNGMLVHPQQLLHLVVITLYLEQKIIS